MSTDTQTPAKAGDTPEHAVASRDEWLAARQELLKKEKALTREYDRLRAERLKLPWVRLEKDYVFEGPEGKVPLRDLFDGRSQLIVYHFMLGPGWEEGCNGCSFVADHMEGPLQHLRHHDVNLVCVSRAPLAEILPFKKRMGWNFTWVSSHESDFNYDFQASATDEEMAAGKMFYNFEEMDDFQMQEQPGLSVFCLGEDGAIYHTYSAYTRGLEPLLGAYMFLDFTPKGRNEDGPMSWVRHHDKYEGCGCGEKKSCH